MENGQHPSHNYEGKQFRNAEEELTYLRQVIVEKEARILAERTLALHPEWSRSLFSSR